MSRFLTPRWVEAVNEALAGVDPGALTAGGGLGSLVAAGGRFRIAQLVAGGPASPGSDPSAGPAGQVVRTTLVVEEGRVWMELDEHPVGEPSPPPDVEVSLSYDDAAALSRGELPAATALRTGRIRVRGDLSVLVAGQALLQAAASRLAVRDDDTTY